MTYDERLLKLRLKVYFFTTVNLYRIMRLTFHVIKLPKSKLIKE